LSHSADKNMVVIQKLVMVFSFVESHYISTWKIKAWLYSLSYLSRVAENARVLQHLNFKAGQCAIC
jgi:hypothetical protein